MFCNNTFAKATDFVHYDMFLLWHLGNEPPFLQAISWDLPSWYEFALSLHAQYFFPLCPFSLLHTTYGLLWFDLFACLDWMDFYWYLVRISYSYAPFFRKLGRYSVLILLTVYSYIWQLKWALNLFTMHRFIKIYCWNATSLQSVHILHLVICLY